MSDREVESLRAEVAALRESMVLREQYVTLVLAVLAGRADGARLEIGDRELVRMGESGLRLHVWDDVAREVRVIELIEGEDESDRDGDGAGAGDGVRDDAAPAATPGDDGHSG